MLKLCLTIGVSKAPPLSHLPGAITVAHEMKAWAEKSGFVTEVITDEADTPVTIGRIRQKLLEMLPRNDEVEHLILHFAGHGFRTGAELNVWLPSDWHQELRAISVEVLKKRLYRYGIKNLTIISDACRTLPSDIEEAEIAGDPVLGKGPYEVEVPIIDRFNAGLDGMQAYMLKGDGNAPSRCIFSTVMLEGLYGLQDEAFDKHDSDSVIPESLALFTATRLKEIGEVYDLRCTPENHPGIPRDHVVYFRRGSISYDAVALKWPDPLSRGIEKERVVEQLHADLASTKYRSLHRHFRASRKFFEKWPYRDAMKFYPDYEFVNLIVQGDEPKRIWAKKLVAIQSHQGEINAYGVSGTWSGATQVLVEFYDGVFASAVVYEDLVTLVSRDEEGEMSWTCISEFARHESTSDFFVEMANLQLGNLSANQVDHIAVRMRVAKHVNPTLGAIASYLYDYMGDIDSIRRMAFFYCMHRQPIPFDVAFMGLLSTREMGLGCTLAEVPGVPARPQSSLNDKLPQWVTKETKETKGQIAGLWPWLRQGWQFMEHPEQQEKAAAEELRDIAKFLLPSQFSSFKNEGGEILIRKFELEANK